MDTGGYKMNERAVRQWAVVTTVIALLPARIAYIGLGGKGDFPYWHLGLYVAQHTDPWRGY